MSQGPENTFRESIHRLLPPKDELYRMKTYNPMMGGVPDDWYSGSKADLWVEYKFIELPKRASTVIDLISVKGKKDAAISSLQQQWLSGRHAEGRNVGVIVGCKDGGVWFPGMEWDRPYTAGEFSGWLKSRKELALLIEKLVNG